MAYENLTKMLGDRLVLTGNSRLFCGLKFIAFTGDLLRAVETEDVVPDFWHRVFSKLPKDAKVANMPFGDGLFIVRPAFEHNAFYDEYLVCFSSREWPPVPRGGIIPIEELKFEDERFAKFAVPRSQWYWRLYIWGAEKAVRWFPKWVRY